jgi:hypothetical protein
MAGTLLFAGACALLCEDAWHGSPHLNHLLQPLLMLGTITAGVMAHHRLCEWRPSGLAFALLALLGSCAVIYATLSRTALARDTAAAVALAENRQLANIGEELVTARGDAARECRSGFGAKCSAAKARIDGLVLQMAGLRSVSADPRGDALARLAELVSPGSGPRTRALVAALDPVVLPLFLEAGCILFFAAAFPGRRKAADACRGAGVEQVLTQPSEPTPARPRNVQEWAQVWNVHPTTAGRRLKRMEAEGRLQRVRDGRSMLALPAPHAP